MTFDSLKVQISFDICPDALVTASTALVGNFQRHHPLGITAEPSLVDHCADVHCLMISHLEH